MRDFNIELNTHQIKFIIKDLKKIEKSTKDEEVSHYSRYVQGNIIWSISRQCGYCQDGIDENECFNKENKDTRYGSCNIENCPLLK